MKKALTLFLLLFSTSSLALVGSVKPVDIKIFLPTIVHNMDSAIDPDLRFDRVYEITCDLINEYYADKYPAMLFMETENNSIQEEILVNNKKSPYNQFILNSLNNHIVITNIKVIKGKVFVVHFTNMDNENPILLQHCEMSFMS